jgi:hypothetical protein
MIFLNNPLLTLSEGLTAAERAKIPAQDYGLPDKRAYPLHDKQHVLSAIRLYNYVDEADAAELAHNIIAKMKVYHIPQDSVSSKNRLRRYLDQDTVNEDELYDTLYIT